MIDVVAILPNVIEMLMDVIMLMGVIPKKESEVKPIPSNVFGIYSKHLNETNYLYNCEASDTISKYDSYQFDDNDTSIRVPQTVYNCEGPLSEWIIHKDNQNEQDNLASYIVVLRIFRVARICKLSRRSHKLTLMAKTITSSLKELSLLFLFICFATILYSTLIYSLEGKK